MKTAEAEMVSILQKVVPQSFLCFECSMNLWKEKNNKTQFVLIVHSLEPAVKGAPLRT